VSAGHPTSTDSRPLDSVAPVFRAVVETVVPEAAELGDAAWREVERLAGRSLASRPPELQRRLRLFLNVLEWTQILRYGRRFTRLSPRRRRRVLARLERHPIRVVRVGFWGLRALALLGYYGRPAASGAIGYRPHARGWEART
jgi:hypothetical protein